MKQYWVGIRTKSPPPLHFYCEFVWSGFVKSEKQTADEVKQQIIEHHRKKGLEGLTVTVIEKKGEGVV